MSGARIAMQPGRSIKYGAELWSICSDAVRRRSNPLLENESEDYAGLKTSEDAGAKAQSADQAQT